MKNLIFVILCGCFFLFLHNLTRLLQLLTFLLMGFNLAFLFLSSQEILYIIHRDLDLFYDIYDTITEHNRKQSH